MSDIKQGEKACQNLKMLLKKQQRMIEQLDRSMLLKTLVPGIFEHVQITTQWHRYPNKIESLFYVKSAGKILHTFNYNDVPEQLRIF